MASNGFSFEEASKPAPTAPAAKGFSFEEASAPTMPAMATEDAYGQFPPQDVSAAAPSAPSAPPPTVDEFGRNVEEPVAGQSGFNEVVNRVGKAAKEGFDGGQILTPEGEAAVDRIPLVGSTLINPAIKAAGAIGLGVPGAVIKGGLEGIAATGDVVGDATGMPGFGQFARGVAGAGESAMADMMGSHFVAPSLRTSVEVPREVPTVAERNADAVAAIGKAPDIDAAIKAAGDAVSRPVDAAPVRLDPAPVADAAALPDRSARVQAERDRLNAMRPNADEAAPIELPQIDVTADAAPDAAVAEGQAAGPVREPAPASVGAAVAADLDPGIGDLTPKQEAAYRATAEGQKLLEPQPYGIEDNTEYLRGAIHSEAESAQTVEAAREQKALGQANPDVAEIRAGVDADNAGVAQRHFEQRAGSDVDLHNAEEARGQQMQQDTDAAWANKSEADITPTTNVMQDILNSRDGRRPLVRGVIESVRKTLFDERGQPITDPEVLYGVGDHINDLLSESDAVGQPKYKRAQAALMQIKESLYNDVIEPAAPGFKQALDNFAQSSRKIDEMKALQKFEPKLYDANNRMTYQKVQTMMRQIVDSRAAPGINVFKSISQETMNDLWDLRDHLRRKAASEKLASTPGGSDTSQNALDQARMKGAAQAEDAVNQMGLAREQQRANIVRKAIAVTPYVGKAMQRIDEVNRPIRDAAAAAERDRVKAQQKIAEAEEDARLSKERSARGLAMLRPNKAPSPRQDIAPRPADFVPNPVQPSAPQASASAPIAPMSAEPAAPTAPVTRNEMFSALFQVSQALKASTEKNMSAADAMANADPRTVEILRSVFGSDFTTTMSRAKLNNLLIGIAGKFQPATPNVSKASGQ